MTKAYKSQFHASVMAARSFRAITAQLRKDGKNCRMAVQKVGQSMGHDSHQTKLPALGIALLVTFALIVFSMHDADVNSGLWRTLRMRDSPSNEVMTLIPNSERNAASPRADEKRAPQQDHRQYTLGPLPGTSAGRSWLHG